MGTVSSNRRLNYHNRLFLWLLGYSLLLVCGFIVFQYHREKEFKASEINSQLQLINTYVLTSLEEGKDVSAIRLDEFHTFEDLRLSVISDDGEIIYDNALDSILRTNHLDRSEIRQAMKYGSGYAVRRHSTSTGASYFYSARKGQDNLIVRTAVPYSVSLSSLLQADYGFLWIMGAITAIMCVLGYFATRRVGNHIMRLNRFAENVERGAQISDTEPFPHDELGEISNNIVRLYAKLQQAYAERDSEHRMALYEQQEKERIKKQLTNNINHELKTPVASIQLCIETLSAHPELSEEKRRRFLDMCLSDTVRLGRLLNDVSLITRLDDGGHAIVKEPVDLTGIIRETVAQRAELAASKGICIRNEVTGELEMTGNLYLIESIFYNLIDNAIAYSGGSRIDIRLVSVLDGKATLEFSDNGNGVPEEHLPRLFERFYRIDKGRSRAAGGTGLGLSIVKNATLLHEGSITVANQAGGGLIFTLVLPVCSR